MENCDFQKLFLGGTVEDENTTGIIPAGNTTVPCSISSQYFYTIVAIYSVVFVLLFVVILIKIVQCVRNYLHPSPYRKYRSGYDVVVPNNGVRNSNNFNDELNPIVDVLINVSHREYFSEPDTPSEYDNVSLDLGRDEYETNEDIPPDYEHPPSYPSSP
ncbi:hypothetical protein NPIL_313801 [Nephila pilipes]|uniref:Uncharacterized protein n=1 Tax=Nephila pilipes TaxID=299642 RepID=A0A8X6P5H0_NEPPI|nr:hypothetical protein NPIL_313801 [Nephila pilipes]